ncbi:hypothetical protein AB0F85_31185 [Nocardia fluminea]|uniref:hypothetical protein n=1 Tax=Nocardia fluminea TaxID=134984 RepID=UPI0034095C2C
MSGDVVVHRAEGRTAHGGAHREFKSSPIGGRAQEPGAVDPPGCTRLEFRWESSGERTLVLVADNNFASDSAPS